VFYVMQTMHAVVHICMRLPHSMAEPEVVLNPAGTMC
jgi:hypothetical protein